ncbi:MAG: hypothetical protein KY468_05920, partial [Armatimonadetes bacterium]|nr:hypothetical protein [Armatimonadota bacterium]
MPAWDDSQAATINGVYDTVIYQYVQTQTGSGGSIHQCYNVRRIVSPGSGSARNTEDRWLLPYDPNRDAVDFSVRRSEPSAEYTTGNNSRVFRYYVQQKDASGNATGQTLERTTESWTNVVMVDTKFIVVKTHHNTTIKADASSRSRLRNWIPPS